MALVFAELVLRWLWPLLDGLSLALGWVWDLLGWDWLWVALDLPGLGMIWGFAGISLALGFAGLGLPLGRAGWGWLGAGFGVCRAVLGDEWGEGSWMEEGRSLEQCLVGIQSGPLAREVLMTQQQQQKRKGGKGRKGSCRARCHGDPKEVWTSPALFTAAFQPKRELWLAIKGDMWPFAHRDRPLQLRVFSSFSPLSPPAIIHSDLRQKKKKKSRTSCAPFALGTLPGGQPAISFSPFFPGCRAPPRFLRSYENVTCSGLINSSRLLSSHQSASSSKESLFQGSCVLFSCLFVEGRCFLVDPRVWLTKCWKVMGWVCLDWVSFPSLSAVPTSPVSPVVVTNANLRVVLQHSGCALDTVPLRS